VTGRLDLTNSIDDMQSNEHPLVSVVVPVYNGERTIRRTIESVFEQRYPNIEIVVVDDASRDATAEILRSFGPRIHALFNPRNRGTGGTYNVGTKAARGDILLLMASDCYLTQPDYIASGLRHFADPRVAAVVGQGVFDHLDRLNTIQRIFTIVNELDVHDDPEEEVFEVAFIETRCDLVRKAALQRIGFWFEDLYNSTDDQDISARMREAGYKLLQDKRLKFALDFGQTEDSLRKVLHKQHRYAHGQAYMFLRYGLGHHVMTGDQENRRRRIAHRFFQIALGPLSLALAVGTIVSPLLWVALLVVLGARAAHYWRRAGPWLTGARRLLASVVGLACDFTYSFSFLFALVYWAVRVPGALRFGKPVAVNRSS
jgi:cellulose synthase/poly-beta-1,6-N-acetylglucosamine synthase-like glycosyltransferase